MLTCSRRCYWVVMNGIRDARKRSAPWEPVRLIDIYERDGWVCHICQQPVDPDLRDRHPMMPSPDHIIPKVHPAYPGHIAANLALAHLGCNERKRARVTAADWELHRRLLTGSRAEPALTLF